MHSQMKRRLSTVLLGAAIAAASGSASAYNLIDKDGTELNFDFEAIAGAFYSEEGYATAPSGQQDQSSSWEEGYIKAGLSGSRKINDDNAVYGGASIVASGTFGDGDAGGFSTGNEREIELEELYAGFRSENIDFSVGSQLFTVGDGFLINSDALNFGSGFNDAISGIPELDRGGAYWLAARKAFDKTAILRLGGDAGLRSDIFWLESGNAAQANMELAGINLEYIQDIGTVGVTYFEGLDVSDAEANFLGLTHRDGQQTLSLRYQGNAGVENLFLSGEYVTQDQGNNSRKDGDAYYVEAGWTFANTAWSPSVNYRYSHFEEGFDPLFFGFNRGYGTWFQGEVAANYAGPFSSNNDVHHIGIKANPTETLTVGALYFDFQDTDGTGANDATELDLYAEWVVNDHLIISPLVGLYTPEASSSTQGNDDTNTYFQVLAIVPF